MSNSLSSAPRDQRSDDPRIASVRHTEALLGVVVHRSGPQHCSPTVCNSPIGTSGSMDSFVRWLRLRSE